ncbi:MAG: amino acid adenylation domain-containing protein [Cyanophyceae cyanobacterium]
MSSTFLDRIKDLSPKRLALLADELYHQLEAIQSSQEPVPGVSNTPTEEIAIIGIGCRFPGGVKDPAAYWQLLQDGRHAVTKVPPERWDVDAYYDPDPSTPGKTYTRWGGFLSEVDRFDADFFGISPREAAQMDPQQRLLLEVSWEALERAGYAPQSLKTRQTGVYVAIGTADYANLQTRGRDLAGIDPYTGFGTGFCFAAGRLSYILGMQGPSLALDAACASSLTAVHLACQSLRNRECQMALVGGVNLMLSPETNIIFSRTQMMAADGRCKTFDAAADGYVRSEGCAAIVLKPLQAATADGDNVLAVIAGSATNHSGASGGLTIPNGSAQQAVVREALRQAGVQPAEVQYVETQGTGTPIGDAVEVRALGAVFQEGRSPDAPLWLASVKTNIGHTETASGLASLIKVVLALQQRALPPHLHLQHLNPEIALDDIPARIPTTLVPLPAAQHPVFGVNSFGMSGANAHVVVRAAPEPQTLSQSEADDRPLHLLSLSAKTPQALRELVERFQQYLSDRPQLDLGDLCFTTGVGRSHFQYRQAWVADSISSLQQQLTESLSLASRATASLASPPLVFAFPHPISSVVDSRQLYKTSPTFRQALTRCLALLAQCHEGAVLDRLYPASPVDPPAAPWMLFVVEYALAELWKTWGIKPDGVWGEGVGEIVAACVAGVFSLEQGISVITNASLPVAATSTPVCPLWCRRTGQMLTPVEVLERWQNLGGTAGSQSPPLRSVQEYQSLNIHPQRATWETLLADLSQLYQQGAKVDWVGFERGFSRQRIVLPTYPFQRQRYWSALAERGASLESDLILPSRREASLTRTALLAIDPAQRQARLAADLGDRLATALGIAPDKIAPDTPLSSLALDSIVALELKFDLEKSFASTIPLTDLLESVDIAALSRRILAGFADTPTTALPQLKPAPERHQPFPLNDIQQAYWLGRRGLFDMGNIAAHVYAEFEGENLDGDRLSKAFQQLIDRHDMLRAIVLPDGQQQILASVPPYTIDVLDLRTAAPAERERQLVELREHLSHQIHAEGQWPLFTVRAVRLDERVRVCLSFDNLLVDGASLGLLCQEWGQLYHNLEASLPPLELSFRDYVLAVKGFESSEVYQRSLTYWQNRLRELPRAPELPLAIAPAQHQQPRFTRRTFELKAETWQKLQQNGSRAGLTPSAILVAAYAEVLAMWSKTRRFTLNLTTFNRLPIHPQVQQVVGDFTSLTLLAVDYTAIECFEVRAQQLQQQLWQDLEHSYTNGVRVMRDLARSESSETTMPVVFTSLLATPQLKGDSAFSTAWLGEMVYGIAQTPQVWLDHQVYEEAGALVLNWDAVEELFPPGTVAAMFAAYEQLLHCLATAPEAWQQQRFALLPDAPSAEPTASSQQDALLHTLFMSQAEARSQHPAIVTSSLTLTYGELLAQAQRVAQYLRHQNVRPNQLVAIAMEKGWEQVVAALGILMAGAAYLPVNPCLPQERRWHLLERGEVSIVLTQSWLQSEGTFPPGLQTLAIDTALPTVSASFSLSVQAATDLAYVIYTSGSTGAPKGVAIDHRGAVNTILDINERFEIGESDRVFALSSLSFDLSVYDIFGTLAAGATIVMPPADAARDPAVWGELIVREEVTIWNSVPTLMQMLVADRNHRSERLLPSLRLVLLSGDWLPLSLPNQIRALSPSAQVISLGGATEASIWSIVYPVDEVEPHWTSIPYGKPLADQRFYVFDDHLEPCPLWVTGQLYIGGVGLAQGYWRDEAKTAASFIVHPRTGERLYRTGDLGRYLPTGDVEFLGRADDQVKINGHRIELGEIETVLEQHPEVKRAVVLSGERKLVAFVLLAADSGATVRVQQDAPDSFSRWQTWVEKASQLQIGETGAEEMLAFWQELEQLYICAVGVALQRLGIWQGDARDERYSLDGLMQRSQISPRYRRWTRRALGELVRHGYLKVGSDYLLVRSLPEQLPPELLVQIHTSARQSLALGEAELALLTDIATHLADILTEKRHSAQIYTAAAVPKVYQQQFQTSHAVMRTAIAALVEGWPSDAPLRMIEVGAGLGATTTHVLPLLPTERTTYVFTDISPYFLQLAEQNYEYPFLQTRRLDLEKPPQNQGYELHSFDVVIAASVLHATRNIAETLSHVRSLLRPGGVLLLLEETKFQSAFELTMGLQQGFDRFEDESLRQHHPLLSRKQWQQALLNAGFSEVQRLQLNTAADRLGFDVFLVRGPSAVRSFTPAPLKDYLARKLPVYMVPQTYVPLERLPLTANGKVDRRTLQKDLSFTAPAPAERQPPRNALEQAVADIWKAVLQRQEISVEDNFFELGGDSLLATQAITRVREGFSVDVPLRTLFEQPTVAALAQAIAEAIAAQIDGAVLEELDGSGEPDRSELGASLTLDGGQTDGKSY